jgi:hypothetical protein
MGAAALQGNGITTKLLYLIRDKTLSSPYDPLHKVRKSRLLMFVAVQLMGFGATFAITQTIGTSLHLDQLLFTDFGRSCYRISSHNPTSGSSSNLRDSAASIHAGGTFYP